MFTREVPFRLTVIALLCTIISMLYRGTDLNGTWVHWMMALFGVCCAIAALVMSVIEARK